MDRSQRIESPELGAFTAQNIAVGAGKEEPRALVAWELSRAFDLSTPTVVAGLLARFLFRFRGGITGGVHCQTRTQANFLGKSEEYSM
jgi:hypothetical protein